MKYQQVVRNYLAMQRGKPTPKTGQSAIIRHLIDLTEHRLGRKPTLIETVGALLLAEYEVQYAPMPEQYYLDNY